MSESTFSTVGSPTWSQDRQATITMDGEGKIGIITHDGFAILQGAYEMDTQFEDHFDLREIVTEICDFYSDDVAPAPEEITFIWADDGSRSVLDRESGQWLSLSPEVTS